MMAGNKKPVAEDKVCIGAITGVRGLRGEVRIKSFTADPDGVAAYDQVTDEAGEHAYRIRVTGHVKGMVIARLDGIDDRDAAESLKGTKLYVPRSILPEPEDGAFYHADLVGLKAETADGEPLGTVKAVHNFGAGDVIEISGGGKDELMVPFTSAAVPDVDLESGRIVVQPPRILETGEKNGKKAKQG